MRKSPATQKTTGSVLVPLFLEQVERETIETAVARAQFDEVWVAFQALQEHDEVLAEIIRHMREERGRTKGYDDKAFRGRVEVLGPSMSLDALGTLVRRRSSIRSEVTGMSGMENWEPSKPNTETAMCRGTGLRIARWPIG
jgi:hypothetical protein